MAMADPIYLDNAATTRAWPEVAAAMVQALREGYGNPSSLHGLGLEAERAVEAARRQIAALLQVSPEELIFTSGGTEANHLAIKGAARALVRRGRHVVTTEVEHASVQNAVADLAAEGYEYTRVSADRRGRVEAAAVLAAVRPDTTLVSVMAANNEVGTLQPVDEIARGLRRRNEFALLHVDGVQAFGKIPLFPGEARIDLYTVSGHKIHGPKGIGALYVRPGVRLVPLFGGGEQEQGLRAGTANVPGIVGMGVAAARAGAPSENAHRLRLLRDALVGSIRAGWPDAVVNGDEGDQAAPHIASIAFPGLAAEVLLHALEAEGVYVSTGSACSARQGISPVLKAIGLPERLARGTLRFSVSLETRPDEVETAAAIVIRQAKELALFART